MIGWGGISSFFTGVLPGTFTKWKLFKHLWVTVKFFVVIGLILFGMFYLESRMLINLDLLIHSEASVVNDPVLIRNHHLIKAGLLFETVAVITIIAISILKPGFRKS